MARKTRNEKAISAIDRRVPEVFDIAANCGQIFDNVKHMSWFVQAVADELYPEVR